MEKAYVPQKYEADIYKLWQNSGAFKPSGDPAAEPFTIVMPPPNANADLHLGHSLSTTLEDIMIRHARMQGKAALFIPGADHAGFETQVVYERQLQSQGKSRFDFDRAELYQQIWDFVQGNKGKMEDQQRRIGASVDWDRNTFTLDPHVIKQAHTTFKKLWDDGLLYRGKRIVNYCTFHGTSFSDLEVAHREEDSHLWHISYPVTDSEEYIEIATTRPETMLGDTAVAVHPDDDRYKSLIGRTVTLPIVGREIPIVGDSGVDPKFGTGAVKVTPAHDPLDFEIAERHNLPAIEVIGKDGKMTTDTPEEFRGLDPLSARKLVVERLTTEGVLGEVEPYRHSVGHCYKCDTTIQPLILDQWLVRMSGLAKRAIASIEAGEVKIVPHSRTKLLLQWLQNIRDWNISRQIVWGIQIPAFLSDNGDVLVDLEESGDEIVRDGVTYTRDPDTFDTWFSSGQWPQATLNYPDSADFKRFYPNSVMETAADILLFWVARMLMLGLYLTEEVPFKTVYLHGLILDEHGKKMSKSKGNVLAPAPLLDRYGADALRMGLVANRSGGMNQGFSEKRVEAYRNFCNKLWNLSRFILGQIDSDTPAIPSPTTSADRWILAAFSRENDEISRALSEYRFSEALERLYSLVWNDLADWYIEASKVSPNASVLKYCLETTLKLAHPFAPFVTEAIWQNLAWQKDNLIVSRWPRVLNIDDNGVDFELVMALVSQIRTISAELRLSKPVLTISEQLPIDDVSVLKKLASLETVETKEKGSGLRLMTPGLNAWLSISDEQLDRYLNSLEFKRKEGSSYQERLKKQLANSSYIDNAPEELVQETRDRLASTELLLSKLDEQIDAIKK